MKYIVLIGDGMADWPIEALGNKTPLETANTPNLDFLSQHGHLVEVQTVPPGMSPGSDVAILSIMGYDTKIYYTGRAPLEAASMGLEVPADASVFRCNTVTVKEGVMVDYAADHITTPESTELILAVDEQLSNEDIQFFPGVSYRHLMVIKGDYPELKCTPPHDILGQAAEHHLPSGPGQEVIRKLMHDSIDVWNNHPVNVKREAEGHLPATQIWLWGQGKMPRMNTFKELFQIQSGIVVSAVDLVKGIGKLAKLMVPDIPGLTGYLDTDYQAKVKAALNGLKEMELAVIHVEAPDECGHQGRPDLKVRAIEEFDKNIIGPMLEYARQEGECRLLVLPDHPTPCAIRTHVGEPVPAVMIDFSQPVKTIADERRFTEKYARESSHKLAHGHELMGYFLKGNWKY
jgi:2,3-bisphosphoglycerate-independent phosphoglycerate mutase